GLLAEHAREPQGGRPWPDGNDPRRAAFGAAGAGPLFGAYLLPPPPDLASRPNPRRGKVEYLDHSPRGFGAVQQDQVGPQWIIAFVGLQALQECSQIADFLGGIAGGAGMAVLQENVLDGLGTVVVEEWPAVRQAPQRRRVELAVAKRIGQTHIVGSWRCIG